MSANKISYGIDFGTTNSSVAYIGENKKLIRLSLDPEADNPTVMRSIIYANTKGQLLYGKSAISAYLLGVAASHSTSKKTISTGNYITINNDKGDDQIVPEIIDIDITDSGRLLQSLKSALSNSVIKHINLSGKSYTVEEVVGFYLKELKNRADKIVGQNVTSVVVGRPVEYVGDNNNLALERMTKACKIAGFKDISFEYEPVGAAFDYGIETTNPQNVLIFDFGGGTLDISVVKYPEKLILLNAGLPIGGDKFNAEIFNNKLSEYFGSKIVWGDAQQELPSYIFIALQNWYETSLLKTKSFANSLENFRWLCSDRIALEHLKSLIINSLGFSMYEEIERVKKNLSTNSEDIYSFKERDLDLKKIITKIEFEKMITDDLEHVREFINNSISSVNLRLQDIDIVATTGGTSLIPIVKKLLEDLFGKNKVKQSDVFTGVASGLAIIAANNIDSKRQNLEKS